jgi:hypothetical protein
MTELKDQNAMLVQMVPVSRVRQGEGISPGLRAAWGHRSTSAAGESQTTRGRPAGPGQLSTWLTKLDSLAGLVTGWDRHGAAAPSREAVRLARRFVEALVNDGQSPTRVAASAVGGVGVTRQAGQRRAYVEFYNDGTACALFTDDSGDEQVLDVPTDPDTFTDLLDKMKAYFNA